MSGELVTITIDGKEVEVPAGELLIKVAEQHGTYIPRFCWHERMEPVGMCRMCLVEIEGVRGFPPSCTTPVTDGMVVHTQSENVRKIQDGVLEFLLVNHPLDCPVCDRGGECPLQDQTLAFGPGESRFVEEKRHFEKPIDLSDLVLLDRERCIQCARCTRFAEEVAGDALIQFVDRGDHTQVLTFPDEPFSSYFSGNTVQICPVGALTATSYRFRARPWDLATVETSCTTCSVGCRGALQSSSNRIVRFLGVDSEEVNHGWLCDKGRYAFEWIHDDDRVVQPQVRKDGELVEASWPEALEAATAAIRTVVDEHGPRAVGLLGGARTTNESAYLYTRLAKGVIGTDHVDAQLGDGLSADVVLGLPRALISDLDRAAGIVTIAPDLKEELPVLYLRARRAAHDLGIPLIEISARDGGLTSYADAVVRVLPGEEARAADTVAAALDGAAADGPLGAAIERIRERDGDLVVVLGRTSLATAASVVEAAAAPFAGREDTTFLSALRRGNVHGALDLGLAPGFLPGRVTLEEGRERFGAAWSTLPDERGLDAAGMLAAAAAGELHALVLVGVDPLADFPDAQLARAALERVDTVISIGAFSDDAAEGTDVLLPATLWGETRGTASNLEGRVARLGRKVTPPGSTMSDWRIAVELALRLGDDFDLESVEEVQDEIARLAPAFEGVGADLVSRARDGVVVPIAEHPDEIHLGAAPPVASEHSWDPIPAGSDAVVGEPDATEGGAEATDASADAEAASDADGPDTVDDTAAVEDTAAPVEPPGPALPEAPLYRWTPTTEAPAVPGHDAYAVRLVVGRKLYDAGRATRHTPVIAELPEDAVMLVHRKDRDRIGVEDGTDVKVVGAHGTFTMPIVADPATPEGVAFVAFGRTGRDDAGIAELIDVGASVTDVRIEAIR